MHGLPELFEVLKRTLSYLRGYIGGKGLQVPLCAAASGLVNGLFGGGGGMVMLPGLKSCGVEEKTAFATCVAIIFPMCAVSSVVAAVQGTLPLRQALPYLIGGAAGGVVGTRLFGKVSAVWLRYLFGGFVLYGAYRYLT